MRLIYHPDAEMELLEAARFYEDRSSGLGARFLREFDATISGIMKAPKLWPIVEGDIRRRVMRKFPFGIYYRAGEDALYVLVVKHHSLHPDYWQYRLGP